MEELGVLFNLGVYADPTELWSRPLTRGHTHWCWHQGVSRQPSLSVLVTVSSIAVK